MDLTAPSTLGAVITQIMGILNVTPDSFSDGGRFVDIDTALDHARQMVADGATVIDVGGESTRPGAEVVSIATELDRVLPVIEAVSQLDVRVSVDTRHAEVAREAVAAGATLINDVGASLWQVAAETGSGWLAMHMQGEPSTMPRRPTYGEVVAQVKDFLVDRGRLATEAGVAEVWIDPGFGFGKSVQHNIDLVASIGEFVDSPYRVALGVSRKKTLGVITAWSDQRATGSRYRSAADLPTSTLPTDPDDRLEAGVALATWAMASGVQMIRVHDVAAHVRAARLVADSPAPATPVDRYIPAGSAGR